MITCEELNCDNLQSGICLHCNQHLCTPHIVKHAKILLHYAVDLHEQVNELTEQLMNASKSVHETYINAVADCNAWRAKALELIEQTLVEQTYNEMMEPIFFQQESFNKVHQDLIRRLSIDALQPLEKMQKQRTANAQALDTIRLTLKHVRETIPLLRWPEKPLLQLPSTKVEKISKCKTETNCVSRPIPLFQNTEEKICTPLNERADPNSPTPWQRLMNDAHSRLRQTTLSDRVDQNSITTATPPLTTFTEQRATNVQSTVTAARSNANQNLKDHIPPKKMVVRFADVYANGDRRLTDYLQNTVGHMKKKKVDRLIKVVLAFLHAWYKNRTSNKSNLILQRVSIVKRYITNDDDKYTIILAVQIFVYHIQEDAQIVQIMTAILTFFLEQQLIQKDGIIDWYNKNNPHRFVGFEQAKECAQEFIGTLQSTTA